MVVCPEEQGDSMDVKALLTEKKQVITAYLKDFFAEKKSRWNRLNEWGPDVLDRLEEFMSKGKMVRGAFVLWTAQSLGAKEEDALPAAAAMEFLQAALLVHDDIMDEDELRRGLMSVHKQYRHLGFDRGLERADHFGVSMGVCVGDLALFLAYEVLARTGDATLISLFSEKSAVVGLGQMQDVYWGMSPHVPDQDAIVSMYEHKTATYTFCLPFLLGARVAKKNGELVERLDDLGKLMGKLFQIKDDELGLYGSDKELGKSIGIDLVTGKKTLHYTTLLSLASGEEQERLRTLQVSDTVSDDDFSFAHGLLEKYDVRSLVGQQVDVLLSAAESLIEGLEVPAAGKELLRSLLQYILERKK